MLRELVGRCVELNSVLFLAWCLVSIKSRPTESMELGEVSSGSSFSATKTGISFQFYDVSLKLPSGRSILQDISMKIPSGSVVAIMGPSGCGKSSITNVLSGRAGYGIVKGDISINGTRGRSELS